MLKQHIDRFRECAYADLAHQVKLTKVTHECLAVVDGQTVDGESYVVEFNVFWDGSRDRQFACGFESTFTQRIQAGR